MMKSGAVIKSRDQYIVHPYSKSSTGVLLACPPYIHLKINDTQGEIAGCILDILKYSKSPVSHPKQTEWKEFNHSYLANLGFKSYAQFHKSCIMCQMEEDEQHLYFTPTINHIATKHFTHLNIEKIRVSVNDQSEKIVTALNKAFQKCEPHDL